MVLVIIETKHSVYLQKSRSDQHNFFTFFEIVFRMFGFSKPATARERISVKNYCIHYMPVFMLKNDAAISMEYKLKCCFFLHQNKKTH